jgi:acetyltransferase
MSVFHLEKIFNPESIAVIGASDKEGSIGHVVFRNLREGGFNKPIYPVTPRHREIMGVAAHSSVRDLDGAVDLAVIATPLTTVPQIIHECVQAQVGGAIIVSAGGREVGAAGREIEQAIQREAKQGSIRIIGPNCLGVISTGTGLNASFASHMALPGSLAFVSQSGAICTAILDLSLKQRIGFSHFVSIGSMLDVDFGDLINYLGTDPKVRSIVLYVESLSNVRKFMSAARAVSRIRPIVVLKSGRCPAGARAAASHTGAMAGEDAVYDAAFKRAGMVRVNTIEELFDCAELMAKQPRPGGPALAVITNAGGPGVMAADALSQYGMEPANLDPATLGRLDSILPPWWSRGNPIDILGDATPERYRQVVEICLSAREIDVLLIILTPQAMTNPTAVAAVLADLLRGRRESVFTVWMGGTDIQKGREVLNEAGVPTYETPERAIAAFMHMYAYRCNLEMLQEIPPKMPRSLELDRSGVEALIRGALAEGSGLLGEVEAKAVLAAYGIPVIRTELARTLEEVLELAPQLGYPLALKVCSPDISHKTEAQGVQLNLHQEADVRGAYARILAGAQRYQPEARVLGVSVQPITSSSWGASATLPSDR